MGLTTREERSALLELARAKTKTTSFSRQLTPTSIVAVQKQQQQQVQTLRQQTPNTKPSPTGSKPTTIAASQFSGNAYQPNGFYFKIDVEIALGPQGGSFSTGPGQLTIGNTPDPPLEADEYADWGRHWSDSLINPHKDTVYMVRASILQVHAEPLLSGFILHWTRPRNWVWTDGQSSDVIVQASSNPLVVIRLIKTPTSVLKNDGFTCSVKQFYL